MSQESLKSVCEYFEGDSRECLVARTEALAYFRDLGPPDLCSLIKGEKGKPNSREIGTYHFVTGVDTSSSASIAAYLNSLTYLMPDGQSWYVGSKSPVYTIRSGTYCCWNSFSRIDVRVEVKIPGGVEAYGVDGIQDQRLELTQELWVETFVSANLRAIMVEKDSPAYPEEWSNHSAMSNLFYQHLLVSVGIRNVNPFPSPRDEDRFLEACISVFANSWQLGNETSNQQSDLTNNHMITALQEYFNATERHASAVKFYKTVMPLDVEIGSLLCPRLVLINDEIEAVTLWTECNSSIPLKSPILLKSQAEFLWKAKKNSEMAVELLKYAVEISPSDSSCWLEMSKLYCETGNFQKTLLALNSCPMFMSDRNFPSAQDPMIPTLFGGVFSNLIEILRVLPSPIRRNFPVNEDSVIPPEILEEIQQVVSSPAGAGLSNTVLTHDPLSYFSCAPRHRDACDVGLYKLSGAFLRGPLSKAYSLLATVLLRVGWDDLLKIRSQVFVMEEEYKQVRHKAEEDSEEKAEDSPGRTSEEPVSNLGKKPWNGSSQLTVSMFDNKRLCERWLDNLFMILYDDLRIFTILKAELNHSKTERTLYKRTPFEWELLGDLCYRLKHVQDAKECYQKYVELRYNFRIWSKLLRIYVAEGKMHTILIACDKLVSVEDRWRWGEVVHPTSPICKAFRKMISYYGADKVKANLLAQKFQKRNETLLLKVIEWCSKFTQ